MITNLNELYYTTFKDGGGTLWLDGQDRTSGYAVALAGYEVRYHEVIFTHCALNNYAEDTLSVYADGLGVWLDAAHQHLYIDSVRHIDNLDYALALGKLNKQLAIYDLTNNQVITL